MTTINLLPWREEKRKLQLQQFLAYGALAVLFVILICIFIHIVYARILKDQDMSNSLLENEITTLDIQIQEVHKIKEDKAYLMNRRQVVRDLETNRSDMVVMFDEFVRTLPDGIYITSLAKKGDEITITGIAESNTRVSELMKNIGSSGTFMSPRLTEIKSEEKDNPSARYFELKIQIEPKSLDTPKAGASSS